MTQRRRQDTSAGQSYLHRPPQRDGPLLYAGEQLVFVPGLGVDARVPVAVPRGKGSVTLRMLRWLPDAVP